MFKIGHPHSQVLLFVQVVYLYVHINFSVRDDWIKIPFFSDRIVPMQIHKQFVRYFRMSFNTAQTIVNLVQPFCKERNFPGGRNVVSVRDKVMMTLNYLGSRDTGFE